MNSNPILQMECPPQHQRRGVLLIEVLAAIVLLAIMSVACFNLFETISAQSENASQPADAATTNQVGSRTGEPSTTIAPVRVDRVALEQFADWYFAGEVSESTEGLKAPDNGAQPINTTSDRATATRTKRAEAHPNEKFNESADWPPELRSSSTSSESWPSVHITWMPAVPDSAGDGDNPNESHSSSAPPPQHRWVALTCNSIKIWRWVRVMPDQPANAKSKSRGNHP